MKNLLANSEASVIRAALDLIDEIKNAGISPKLQYVELDARVELRDGELPPTDILGVTQFAITEIEKNIWQIHFMIAVSTITDENLFRLRAMANVVFERFPADAQMTYFDAETAENKSWIHVLPGTSTIPTHRVETRPFRFIQVQALLDPLQGAEPAPQSLVP